MANLIEITLMNFMAKVHSDSVSVEKPAFWSFAFDACIDLCFVEVDLAQKIAVIADLLGEF